MRNLSNYIQGLNFEYAVSYSGLRGEKFINLEIKNEIRIKQLEEEVKSARFMQKRKISKKIEELKREINPYSSRIVNNNGVFHKSTRAVHRFGKEDKEIQAIFKILNSKFKEQVFAMCPPALRDSIVFYSKQDQIVGILQMCFSCWWMKNEQEEDLKVDHKIFPILKAKLIQIGHKIEEE